MKFADAAHAALTRAGHSVHDTESGHDGMMVCLSVPPETAHHLAVPGGESAGELHITLCFLGKASEFQGGQQAATLAGMLAKLAGHVPALQLHVTGSGSFQGAGEGGTDAAYLDVAGEGLLALRAAVVQLCERAGLPASTKYKDFHPHVTLAYQPAGHPHPDPQPPATAFSVPELELWIAGRRTAFPFRQDVMSKADGGEDQPTSQTKRAQAVLARLGGDMVQIDRDQAQARRQTEAVRAHHQQCADGLGAAIRAPRGSALEDAYMEHAAEARSAGLLADH